MTLPVSIFAAEARFLPRRSHEEPRLSLVVRIGHLPAPVFEGQLADLAAWATDDVEFLVLDEALEGRRRLLMDAFRESDDRVAIVRFSRYRGIPAIGINLALQRASGQWVAYQTGQAALIRGGVERMMAAGETAGGDVVVGGCRAAGEGEGDRAVHFGPMLDAIVHRHRLLEGVGLADPHLLLAEAWGADLAGRLLVGGVTVELPAPDVATHVEGPQYFASAFADARRSESRASELTIGAIARVDVLSDGFLPTGEAHRRYCDELVAPYVSRYWQEGACLHSLVARHLAVGPRLKVRLRGVPALPSVEITYGNFVRTFPECLDLRFSSPKAMGPEFSADDDLVVNFRLSDEIAHHYCPVK